MRRRQGFALVTVVFVMVIVGVVGAGLHFRLQRSQAMLIREQSAVACRLLADSGIDWAKDAGTRGTLKDTDVVDLPGGRAGYAVSAERTDADGRRFRDAVAFGLAGRYRRVIAFRLAFDPPVGGRTVASAELPTDVSGADLGPVPPPSGGAAALVTKALTAARNAAP